MMSGKRWVLCGLTAVFSCLFPSRSDAGNIVIQGDLGQYAVSPLLHIFIDTSKSMELAEIQNEKTQARFEPTTQQVPSFGYADGAVWTHAKLENQRTDGEYLLEIAYPVLDRIDVFVVDGKNIVHKTGGDSFPFGAREWTHRNFVFALDLPRGKNVDLYVRVQTGSAIQLPITLWTRSAFIQKDHNEQAVLWIYYGIVIIMALYNFFLFFSLRDPSYLWYVGSILSTALVLMVQNGLAYEYLWPDSVWWNNQTHLASVCFMIFFSLRFALRYLHADEVRWLSLPVGIYSWVSLAIALLTLIPGAMNFLKFSPVHVSTAILALAGTGLTRMIQGYRPALYFNIAWIFLLTGGMLLVLKNVGAVPTNFITTYGLQIGSALEVLFLAVGLGYRINLLRKEKEEAEREVISTKMRLLDSFARFVPREFLEHLGRDDVSQVGLGDSVEKNFTVLFNDIRNFTGLSEHMSVNDNFRFLNAYMGRMGPVIARNGGFVDKFIGDAILALFPGNVEDAVRAAVEMRRTLNIYNLHRNQSGYMPIDMGVGLHVGTLMLGTVGSHARLDTTVIGDTVNLASRLENLTKRFGAQVIASGSLYKSILNPDEFHWRELARVRVKGKIEPVHIYEIFSGDHDALIEAKLRSRDDYLSGLDLYRRGRYADALRTFAKLIKENPDDTVLTAYSRESEKMMNRHGTGSGEEISAGTAS